jgi:hypothetical protein
MGRYLLGDHTVEGIENATALIAVCGRSGEDEPGQEQSAQSAAVWRHYNSAAMAAGDAQRVWFPEMIEKLRSQWQEGMSFDAMVHLRDELDAMLQRIRSERHIRPPVLRCGRCGHVGEGAATHVSVRAMILSLIRFGVAAAEPTYAVEKRWAAYRKQNRLDLNGKALAATAAHIAGCIHPEVREGRR